MTGPDDTTPLGRPCTKTSLPVANARNRPSAAATRRRLGPRGVILLAVFLSTTLVAVASRPGGVSAASAHANTPAACTAPSVAVVVDFSHWNEAAIRVCVPWSATLTGYGLLHAAGFTMAGTVHDGPAFICRISFPSVRNGTGFPTAGAPDNEACVLTPPASAYWSYWHADPGAGTWSYSQLGAMSYHPEPGSVDAWTFGPTDIGGTSGQPQFSPASVLPSRSSSPPAQPASSDPAVSVPGSSPGRGSDGSSPLGTGPDPTPTTAAGAPSVSTGTTGRRSSSPPSTTTASKSSAVEMATSESGSGKVTVKTVKAGKPAGPPRPSGSPLPTIIAIGVVVAGAFAALLIARSRGRRPSA